MRKLRLCYIRDVWAFFTTKEIKDQHGDDWDYEPYEHNSGYPYEFRDDAEKRGEEPWQIVRVAYIVNLEKPCDGVSRSRYSVYDINNRATPWLQSGIFGIRDEHGEPIQIWAGCTLEDFIKVIGQAKGEIYVKFDIEVL